MHREKNLAMKNICLIGLIGALLIAGCSGGRQLATRYYLIEYPEFIDGLSDTADVISGFGTNLFIAPAEIHPAYGSHQIVIREDIHQINYFSFNEWAIRPSQSLQIITNRYIREAGWFDQIVSSPSEAIQGHTLLIRIHQMELVHQSRGFFTSLKFEFELTDRRSGQVMQSGLLESNRPLAKKDLNLFAASIAELYLVELSNFLTEAYNETSHE